MSVCHWIQIEDNSHVIKWHLIVSHLYLHNFSFLVVKIVISVIFWHLLSEFNLIKILTIISIWYWYLRYMHLCKKLCMYQCNTKTKMHYLQWIFYRLIIIIYWATNTWHLYTFWPFFLLPPTIFDIFSPLCIIPKIIFSGTDNAFVIIYKGQMLWKPFTQ